MDKKVNELLKTIQAHRDNISNWEDITSAFAEAIKKKGLKTDDIEEINERILKGFNKK